MNDKDEIKHADLSARTQAVNGSAPVDAARRVFENGGSPREQLDAARKVSSQSLGYLPHQGKRERERRLRRMRTTED